MQKIKSRAIVVDGDNTLWKGNIAEEYGKELIFESLLRFDLATVVAGYKGAKHVKELMRSNGANSESEGLRVFYKVLVENGLGRREDMLDFASDYIKFNQVWPVSNFIKDMAWEGIPAYLSTIGGSTMASAAERYFCIYHGISNQDIFDPEDGHKLVDVQICVRNGEEKLEATARRLRIAEIRIEDCAVVGDSENDIPLLKSVKERFASPFASDSVKKIPGIIQLRY